MIKVCVFDVGGNLINIGEWDTQPEQVEVTPAVLDGEQNVIDSAVYETVERNPLPDGAYSEECEVIYDDRHGWRLAGAPLLLSPQEQIERLEQEQASLLLLLVQSEVI